VVAKSKIVSFRLSAEEYARVRKAADAIGASNLSLLARMGLQRLIEEESGGPSSLDEQVRALRTRIEDLAGEVERLGLLVAGR